MRLMSGEAAADVLEVGAAGVPIGDVGDGTVGTADGAQDAPGEFQDGHLLLRGAHVEDAAHGLRLLSQAQDGPHGVPDIMVLR